MPKVSAAHLEARRQQILDAALACFARNGFHETTIQDICREAELSHGAVYRYFASKDDIIAAAAARSHDARLRRFEEAEHHGGGLEALQHFVRLTLGRWAQPEQDAEIAFRAQVLAEAVRNPRVASLAREGASEGRARMSAIVRRGQERGEIPLDLDADAVADVVMALNLGLAALKVMDPAINVDRFLDVVQALLSCGARRASGKEDAGGNHTDQVCRGSP